jgi:hypothetical protein
MTQISKGLERRFFHSYHKDGELDWQGYVVCPLPNDRYLVQLMSWLDGSQTEQKMVDAADMKDWSFYKTAEDMRWAFAQKTGMSEDDYKFSEKIILN